MASDLSAGNAPVDPEELAAGQGTERLQSC
jgi:hypothetical protein